MTYKMEYNHDTRTAIVWKRLRRGSWFRPSKWASLGVVTGTNSTAVEWADKIVASDVRKGLVASDVRKGLVETSYWDERGRMVSDF